MNEAEIFGRYNTADFEAMTDEELVELAKIADCGASDELYHRYKRMVRGWARPYFLMGADREDLVQEGMVGFYKAIRDYDHSKNSSFHPFAELCVTRQLLTAIKSASRDKHIPLNRYESLYRPAFDDDSDKRLMDVIAAKTSQSPEELLLRQETAAAIEKVLSTSLSPLERDVLTRYLCSMTYNDIAAEVGRSVKSVDNALQRIKKKLERYLNDNQS